MDYRTNRGAGYETARQPGQKGNKVLVGAGSQEYGKETEAKFKAEGFDAELVLLAIAEAKTHQSAAQYVEEHYGKLDVSINNAAIKICTLKENSPFWTQ